MIIVRRDGECLFITQRDHAALAGEIMHGWRDPALERNPRRDDILLATREHDNGWMEEDRDTHVAPDGAPLDFVTVPHEVKQRIWPRAVARVGGRRPYAAALIAQHAITVHGPYRKDPAWDAFFAVMDGTRAAWLARLPSPPPRVEDDYPFVRIGDLLSLVFCNAWLDPHDLPGGGRTILREATLEVSPDPFAGARIALRVRAKRLRDVRYASAAAFRAALAAAPVEIVEGVATGVP